MGTAESGQVAPDNSATLTVDRAPVLTSADRVLARTAAGRCLKPLLQALGWGGEALHLTEVLPYFADQIGPEDIRIVLANLHFVSVPFTFRLEDLKPDYLPCLFSKDDEGAVVVLARNGDKLSIFDGADGTYKTMPATGDVGTIYLFDQTGLKETQENADSPWLHRLMIRFRPLVAQLLAVSFFSNLLALAVPIFIMGVYDRVIATQSYSTLAYFVAGVAIAIGVDILIRLIRARAVSYLGARLDMLLGSAVFQHLLFMQISMTERAPVGAQLSRLKQFESIREAFTGPIFAAVLDMPFILVFVVAAFLLGGPLGWIPVSLIALYGIMGAIVAPLADHRMKAAATARSQRQSFLLELLTKHRTVRECTRESKWCTRFRDLSAQAALANFRGSYFASVTQTLSQTLMMLAGSLTIVLGTKQVIDGDMSIGALIATMALIWRVLTPIQAIFVSFNRLGQVIESLRQINQLMRIPLERQPGRLPTILRHFTGNLVFQSTSFKYFPGAEPALMAANFAVKPGELIAITGPNGAGKSTILQLALGLYTPQGGSIFLDGLDLRQIDAGELRRAIAYAPQNNVFYHGSIAQNLRLAEPTATDQDVRNALDEAGLTSFIAGLPEGINTRLSESCQTLTSAEMKQRLNLARAYIKTKASLYLFDEPGEGLDDEGEAALIAKLNKLRGRATTLITTQRPSHMRLVDRIIYLERGRILMDGPPDEILPRIPN